MSPTCGTVGSNFLGCRVERGLVLAAKELGLPCCVRFVATSDNAENAKACFSAWRDFVVPIEAALRCCARWKVSSPS
jgi:hypothetical protein